MKCYGEPNHDCPGDGASCAFVCRRNEYARRQPAAPAATPEPACIKCGKPRLHGDHHAAEAHTCPFPNCHPFTPKQPEPPPTTPGGDELEERANWMRDVVRLRSQVATLTTEIEALRRLALAGAAANVALGDARNEVAVYREALADIRREAQNSPDGHVPMLAIEAMCDEALAKGTP